MLLSRYVSRLNAFLIGKAKLVQAARHDVYFLRAPKLMHGKKTPYIHGVGNKIWKIVDALPGVTSCDDRKHHLRLAAMTNIQFFDQSDNKDIAGDGTYCSNLNV